MEVHFSDLDVGEWLVSLRKRGEARENGRFEGRSQCFQAGIWRAKGRMPAYWVRHRGFEARIPALSLRDRL